MDYPVAANDNEACLGICAADPTCVESILYTPTLCTTVNAITFDVFVEKADSNAFYRDSTCSN
jgi:hypothetical protein